MNKDKTIILDICDNAKKSKYKITTRLIKEEISLRKCNITNSTLFKYLFDLNYRTLCPIRCNANENESINTNCYFSKKDVYSFLKKEHEKININILGSYKSSVDEMIALNDFYKSLTSFSVETIDIFECNPLKPFSSKTATKFYLLKIKLYKTEPNILKCIKFNINSMPEFKLSNSDISMSYEKNEFTIFSSSLETLSSIRTTINKPFEDMFFKPKNISRKNNANLTDDNLGKSGTSTKINFKIEFKLPSYVNLPKSEFTSISIRTRFVSFLEEIYQFEK